jgi:phosphoribosylaminoimidazolecarboxamide formyltransferase/IMP cyclohydrolase
MGTKYALLSVSDKRNIIDFAKNLIDLGFTIIATGKTCKLLTSNNLNAIEVSSITNFPEILDGRVKTLNPKIFGGILYNRKINNHIKEIEKLDIPKIDLVCVNLYPFKETIEKNCAFEEIIENIDIGGPSLLRAGAKNFESVLVVSSPDQYDDVINKLKKGEISFDFRKELACKVFALTKQYDEFIYNYLSCSSESKIKIYDNFYEKKNDLRYGENPHQKAEVFIDLNYKGTSVINAKKLHGKELSYNNIIDLNSALEIILELNKKGTCIVKHANPCGIAISDESLSLSLIRTIESDPVSHFGGVIGFNEIVDLDTAKIINKYFYEAIIAPDFKEDALSLLKEKKNLRILKIKNLIKLKTKEFKSILGGVLVQDSDDLILDENLLKPVTKIKPTKEEFDKLKFAYFACKHVKSNAIVLADDKQTFGIGAGQPNRVDSVKIAILKAQDNAKKCALASDGFFPFPDSIEEAYQAGIKAIIQPGGSIKDSVVIKACDDFGITMVFTGVRHFKH